MQSLPSWERKSGEEDKQIRVGNSLVSVSRGKSSGHCGSIEKADLTQAKGNQRSVPKGNHY